MIPEKTTMVVLVAFLAVVMAVSACGGSNTGPPATPPVGARVVEVELLNFEFRPGELTFRVGETVQFELRSKDIDHTFTVQDLGINWFTRTGGEATETFTFTTAGEFPLLCIIAGHEEAGMVGRIRVLAS